MRDEGMGGVAEGAGTTPVRARVGQAAFAAEGDAEHDAWGRVRVRGGLLAAVEAEALRLLEGAAVRWAEARAEERRSRGVLGVLMRAAKR